LLLEPPHVFFRAANVHSEPGSNPSANEGTVLGVAVRARATATFAAAKHGLRRGAGPEIAGEVRVIEISIPREVVEEGA
jgi:hypothetical protein